MIIPFLFILGYTFVPAWWKNGSRVDFNDWYPGFGNIIFYVVHYGFYLFIIGSLTLALIINWQRIKRRELNLKVFYVFVFVGLIIQFIYCKYNPEFYPAVMMPLFDGGTYNSIVVNPHAELIVYEDSTRTFRIRTKELLDDFVGSRPHKDKVSLRFLSLEKPDDTYKKWLKEKLIKILPIRHVLYVDVLKVESTYRYSNKLHLIKEESTKIQTIYF